MPHSRAQVRYAHAVASGKARKGGMPPAVAKEIVGKMHGKKMSSLPEKSKKKKKLFGSSHSSHKKGY